MRGLGRLLAVLLAVAQGVLGARVLLRLARTARGTRIELRAAPAGERVAVVVPVLNERGRLGPCLEGLIGQGEEVAEILVVDGGSSDGTQGLVAEFAARDGRLRLVDAAPVPDGVNGKAYGLRLGVDAIASDAGWVLTIDADVRPRVGLVGSLVAHARTGGVRALSVATLQEVSGAGEGVLHPALLTTLVYRFGIPGGATDRVGAVQANGQCFLVRRETLAGIGGFAAVEDSVCEDVTLARALAAAGERVGFYETEGLVSAAMYAGWRDAWRGWTRSLPMRDRYSGVAGWVGLAEVALAQAAPVPVVVGLGIWRRSSRDRLRGMQRRTLWTRTRATHASPLPRMVVLVNGMLAVARLGVLVGTARAYPGRPWTYWVSPVCDVPAAFGVWLSAGRRRHTWRGRVIVRGGSR